MPDVPNILRSLALLSLCVGALATAGDAAAAPSNGTSGEWTLVGSPATVASTARIGDSVYMGGNFSGIARRAPGLARVDAATGQLAALPDVKTDHPVTITALAPASDGGAYVAGDFTTLGEIDQPLVARFAANGTVVESFDPRIEATIGNVPVIRDIEVGDDGTVYLAGEFSSVNGQPRDGLAAVDGLSGAIKPWNPSLTPSAPQVPISVELIELAGDTAYLAGDFVRAGELARPGLAQVSLSSGAPTAWNPRPDIRPSALEVAGSTVYLGGRFRALGAVPRANLAAVQAGGTGAVLPFDPAPSAPVRAISVRAGTVYVSGSFGRIGAQAPQALRSKLAAVDAVTGVATSWNVAVTDTPSALLATDDRVYLGLAGGAFDKQVGGLLRCGLAVVDAASGAVAAWDPKLVSAQASCGGREVGVTSIVPGGDGVWAGGDFQAGNVLPRTNLAAFDVASGQPLDWAPIAEETTFGQPAARDLAVSPDGSTIYLGGGLTAVNGVARLNAAAVSATGPANTAAAVTPFNPAPNRPVNAILPSAAGDRVYLGGEFASVRGMPRSRLAAVAASNGLPSSWAPQPNANVLSLALAADGRVFAGGIFTLAGAQIPAPARQGVVALDPVSGEATPWDAALPADGRVDSLALAGETVFVGGTFTGAGGQTRTNVAALDLSTAAAGPFAPVLDAGVRQVSVAPDGTVYLFGTFTSVNGAPRNFAASVSAGGVVTGWAPSGIAVVAAPAQFAADKVLIGGSFTRAGDREQVGFALFGAAQAPGALRPPRVTGDRTVGGVLRCQPGAYTGGPFTPAYAWLRDGAPIAGETVPTHSVTSDDSGSALACEETVFNAAGELTQASDPVAISPRPPQSLAPPLVGGEPWAGGTASCSTGLWRNVPDSYLYRWLLDDAVVAGADQRTFTIAPSDLGRALACEVDAVNAAGTATARSAPVTITDAPPRNTTPPSVLGDPRIAADLTCDPGAWTGAPAFAYVWLRDGVTIPGTRSASYAATSADLGRGIACRVTATNAGGSGSADSAEALVQPPDRAEGTRADRLDRTPPEARPAPPVASLRLSSVRTLRNRTLVLTIRVPAAGALRVTSTSKRTKRGVVIARARMQASRARTVTVRLAPGAKARRELRRAGRRGLRVSLVASFQPAAAGPAARVTRAVTLRPLPRAPVARTVAR